jgi:hypothetical protein
LTSCGWGGGGGMQISTVFSTVISTVNSSVDYCPTPELLTAMSNFATYCRWVPPFNSERAEFEAVWLGWWGLHANFQCYFQCISTVNSTVDYCPTPELLTAMPSFASYCIWLLSIYSERVEFDAVWLGRWGGHANFHCNFHCKFHCKFHCRLLPNPRTSDCHAKLCNLLHMAAFILQ